MTLMKKTILLASMAMMALAFAIPASASAYKWTANSTYMKQIEVEEEIVEVEANKISYFEEEETAPVSQQFEGRFGFSYPSVGSFDCDATIEVEVSEGSGGKISKLVRDASPETCEGTGRWNGCYPAELTSNVAAGWNIDVKSSPVITSSSGTLAIVDKYEGCSQLYPYTMSFQAIQLVPTLDSEGRITKFVLEGTQTTGVHVVLGTFTPTGSLILGLK